MPRHSGPQPKVRANKQTQTSLILLKLRSRSPSEGGAGHRNRIETRGLLGGRAMHPPLPSGGDIVGCLGARFGVGRGLRLFTRFCKASRRIRNTQRDSKSGTPTPTPKPHHVVPDPLLGPQSFHLLGAHPEGVGVPRAPPDLGHRLSSGPLGMGKKR